MTLFSPQLENRSAVGETRFYLKLGEFLREMEKNKGGRPQKTAVTSTEVLSPTLEEIGVSENLSREAQTLAALPEEEQAKVRKQKKSKRVHTEKRT